VFTVPLWQSKVDLMTNENAPPDRSELVEEVDGQTVYLIGDDVIQRHTLIDWGARHPDKIRLMNDLVVLRPDTESGVTKGGIHIPGKYQDDQYNRGDYIKSSNQYHTGVVLELGPGRYDNKGRRMGLDMKKGDRVCYHRASSTGVVWLDAEPAAIIHADGGDKGDAIAWVIEED
jgi:co-chaperonin GroES (HSP10)